MSPGSPLGYSGTPLSRKLGYREGTVAFLSGAPADYKGWLEPVPAGVVFEGEVSGRTDLVHLFETDRSAVGKLLALVRRQVKSDAAIWVSWPKKSSKVPTTLTEDTLRELAGPLGLVDIKVCAVSEIWSGLKLVLRKELR